MSKLSAFVKDQNRVAQYRSWISAPIGQEVLEVIREGYLRPSIPGRVDEKTGTLVFEIDAQKAAFCLGENAGAWKIFDVIRDLPNLAVQQSADPTEVYATPHAETETQKF